MPLTMSLNVFIFSFTFPMFFIQLRLLSRQPSNPFNLVLGGAVAAVVAASPHYKAAAAASVVALLGVGIAYWYFKK